MPTLIFALRELLLRPRLLQGRLRRVRHAIHRVCRERRATDGTSTLKVPVILPADDSCPK